MLVWGREPASGSSKTASAGPGASQRGVHDQRPVGRRGLAVTNKIGGVVTTVATGPQSLTVFAPAAKFTFIDKFAFSECVYFGTIGKPMSFSSVQVS